MAQQRFKGQSGMGSRGKNQPKSGQPKTTARRQRKTGGGATLTKPSDSPRANQRRNQSEWQKKKRMQTRY